MHQNRLYDGAWLIRMLPSKGAAKGVICEGRDPIRRRKAALENSKFRSVGPLSLGFGPASVGLSIVSQLMAISSYRRKRNLSYFLYRLH